MVPIRGRLEWALLAWALWMSGGASASAACGPDVDLAGSWQVDIDCSLFPVSYATATSFLLIERDAATGDYLSTIPQCGTLSVPGEIVEIGECASDPDPTPIGCGSDGERSSAAMRSR